MSVLGLKGVGVSRGIAIGPACVLQRNRLSVRQLFIAPSMVEVEVQRFEKALQEAKTQLAEIRGKIPDKTSVDIVSFIDTHLLMLEDKAVAREPVKLIREKRCNAEWALKLQRDALVAVFEEMDDPYLRTRKDDVDHVVTLIQRTLLKKSDRVSSHEGDMRGCVIVADDLSPADTINMQDLGVAAFVTEFGGPTSHTTILARSLGIPAVVGVRNLLRYIEQCDELVVDGRHGVVINGPDERGVAVYRSRQAADERHAAGLRRLKTKPAVSRDGMAISLQANVELLEDLSEMKKVAAKGVGLYRTEYLFMNRDTLPDEEEQYQAYLKVVKKLGGAPLTIRTLDLGADKAFPQERRYQQRGSVAMNPALGLRAIRLCLRDTSLFMPQVRAILRVAAAGPVNMMLPMISCEQEVVQALELIEEAKQQLAAEALPFDAEVPIGGMIEIPAAVMIADVLARHLDFFSIGTNDLIQYTMAADRLDNTINYLYQPLHPGVLKMIDLTIKAGRKAGIPVSMCGEMAGEARYTRLLLGLGLRQFSMQPAMLPEVKDIVQQTDVEALAKRVGRIRRMASSSEVERFVDRLNADV